MTTKMIRNSRGLRYLVVAMVAMLLIAPATAVAVPSPPHEVFGTVSDQNGNAVDGLTVTVTDEDGNSYTATTDADGYYEIKFPAEDGSKGETLTVSVEGKDASDTTSFESATSERIDLSVEVDTGGGGGGGDDGGDTGGGGGGGGGGAVAPPEDTAEPGDGTPEPVSETADLDQDGAAQVQLSGGTGATSVSVTVPGATGQATVEELPEPPADVPAPEGDYVSGVDISAPDPAEGETATVSVSISQSRLDELGVSAEQLVIQHYRDGAWETLETSAESQDGEVVLSAETTGFSPFAITTQDDQAQVTTTAVDTTAQPDDTTDTPATQATTTSPPGDGGGGPGPLLIAGVVIVVLALVAALYLTNSRE